MKKMKRAIHFDFHTMPGITDIGANIDAKKFADQMAAANVDYVNVFARCNIGYSFYPTKIGEMYPGLKTDFCGDLLAALKERGIGVTLYLNGGLNHMMMVKHPEIMKVGKDGKCFNDPEHNMNFFRTPCFNSSYTDHLLGEIGELLEMDPDGIFVDCLIPRPCYCHKCIEGMKAAGLDPNNDSDAYEYGVKLILGVMERIRALVPANKRLILNSFAFDGIHDMLSHSELECLPTDPGEWGYDYIAAMAPYQRMFKTDRLYMTGCFVGSWGDFGGKKSRAAIENDVFDGLLYSFCPSIGDHMHPRDGANEKLYRDVGEIYSFVRSLEQWTDGAVPLTEAAILRNKFSYTKRPKVSQSDKGAARMLSELKICYDIVNEDMCLDSYKLIVIPDGIVMSEKLIEKLKNFKGAILSSGRSYAECAPWDFFTACDDSNTDGYYVYFGEVLGQYSIGVKMKSDYSVSDYVEPYFRREFDGTHAYFYNPPKGSIGYSSIALKDKIAHLGFKPFEAYLAFGAIHIKNTVKDIIGKLLPEPLIRAEELPSTTRATLMKCSEGELLHVKTTVPEHRGTLGIIEEHAILAAGRKISVKGEYTKAYLLPKKQEISLSVRDGYTELTLPEIVGYAPLLLVK